MSDATSATGAEGPRRRALVTGASSGIGRVFAERLARDGWDLTLVARSRDALEALAKDLHESRGVDVEVLAADLTDAGELHRVEERVAAEPRFDLVVNNAGIGTAGPFHASDVEREDAEIRLNVLALVRITRAALPGMVTRDRGGIINVSSLAAYGPSPYNATYGATKAFVNSFSEALFEELRGTGVTVQALCPGFTRTRFQETAGVAVQDIPDFAWMEPGPVVDASLAALEGEAAVCVPGLGNRALAAVSGIAPRAAFRRLLGVFGSRNYAS